MDHLSGVPQWWMEKRFPNMKLSKEKCDQVNAIERDKALAWVERNIKVPLTEPQKAGIASFCPYNIGPGKCFPSTFYKRLNAGDRKRRMRGDSLVDKGRWT